MKRPMLFYTPGLISLLVVPVLFYMYQPSVKKQTVLKLFIPTEDKPSPYGLWFSRSTVIAGLNGKKINTVYLDGDHTLNATKLEFIAGDALKLKFYHDTTQVIKVRFSDETTYNEFVQVVNIMHKDSHKRYALLDNDFYIFGETPPEPQEFSMICGLRNDVIPIQKVKTRQERFSEQINYYRSFIVNNGLLLSAFVLLIIVPVFLKRKRGIF
jgi:biopolymer transport protein ExbD